MKQNKFFRAWVFLAVVTLSSCYPGSVIPDPYIVDESRQRENIYYVPSAPSTALLSEKNDLNFNINRTSGSRFTGYEIQAAYLPWKHIGITGSYSHAGNKDGKSGYSSYMRYNRFEIGSGYIARFSRGWHFETYAGFGNGTIFNFHYTGTSKLNLTHFFLQPAIAISNEKKTVQLGLISRFEGVNFKVMDTLFSNEREPFSASQVKSLYDQPFHIMWQPGFVFRFGWKNFQLHTGYSYSADLTNPDLYRAKDNFSLGLSLHVNTGEKRIAN